MKKDKVQKPNNQIELKQNFTAPELDALDIIICQAKACPGEFRVCKIDTAKYEGLFLNSKGKPLSRHQIYTHLSRGIERLWDREIVIDMDGKSFFMRILSAKAIDTQNGVMQVHIAPEFGNALQKQIDEFGYTLYDLRYQLALTDKYAKKLYPMMSRYKNTGIRYDDFELLKEKLGATSSVRQHEFMNYLQRAMEQINRYTDIQVNIKTLTKKSISGGSKITNIEFAIAMQENALIGLSEQQRDCIEYTKSIFADYVSEKEAFLLSAEAKYDKDKINNAKTILDNYKGRVNNVAGFLMSAVKNDWEKGNSIKNDSSRKTKRLKEDNDFEYYLPFIEQKLKSQYASPT